MNLRDALRLALDLGVEVAVPRRTGEVRLSYPGLLPAKQDRRRKDAARCVVVFLREVRRLRGGDGGRAGDSRRRR